jgi:hypothetical protein
MHYLFGKAAVDQTTKDYLERHNKQNPAQIYQDRMQDWISAANRLKAVMEK